MNNTVSQFNDAHGDGAYTDLFREHSRLIFKLINNFIRAKNITLHKTEVDDIYQEVALKIFKNDYLAKYNSQKSSFITWLNIICRTTAIDYYRKKLRWMEAVLADSPAARTEGSVENSLFSLPAGVLTDRQTQVITLLYKEGLVPGEIAERLGITSRTVRSIKFQALGRLREHYGASPHLNEHTDSTGQIRRKVS